MPVIQIGGGGRGRQRNVLNVPRKRRGPVDPGLTGGARLAALAAPANTPIVPYFKRKAAEEAQAGRRLSFEEESVPFPVQGRKLEIDEG